MSDEPHRAEQTDAKNDRPNEPLGHGLPSADEPDQADGAFEAPAEIFRSGDEIEALRAAEGPEPHPTTPPGATPSQTARSEGRDETG